MPRGGSDEMQLTEEIGTVKIRLSYFNFIP